MGEDSDGVFPELAGFPFRYTYSTIDATNDSDGFDLWRRWVWLSLTGRMQICFAVKNFHGWGVHR